MASRGDGTYGRHSVLDGTGVVRPAPRTPARLAGGGRRETVPGPGAGGAGGGAVPREGSGRDRPRGKHRPGAATWPSSSRLWRGRGRRSPEPEVGRISSGRRTGW